ncbi:growth arrest and DNA-damage-inducible, beta b [Sardina pilchardus]|uniref:growth arrest and DNA-damage-inducible, beta b n=1 Tax=Sardina pilchardus TaxID=27697 RepID=UPI002E110A55
MTFEEVSGCNTTDIKMDTVSQALEELLVAAQRQNCLTVGVYESAKLMNVDPDNVVLCILATDEEDENDVALQIHFTLIQAFCCDFDINILRVSGMKRLAQVLGETLTDSNANESKDLHCILVTNPHADHLKLNEVGRYCKESRCNNQWVPSLALRER